MAPMYTPYIERQKWFPWQRPLAPVDPHLTRASLGTSVCTTQTASPSVQPLCTDDRRVSLYFTMGRPFPPKIAHGDLDPI